MHARTPVIVGLLALTAVAAAQDPPARPALPAITAEQAMELALEEITKASLGDDAALRANAIESLVPMPTRALPVIQRGLGDENQGVRFAAAVAAGLTGQKNLAPSVKPLAEDDSANVRAAAIYALNALGERVNLTPLADMLDSDDPGLRSNVAMLLGLLGDASAVPMLKRAAQRPMLRADAGRAAVTRIQIAEAIAKLGDDDALHVLRAGAFSNFGEVQVIAILALGDVKDQRMKPGLGQFLDRQEVELRLAAGRTLAKLGDERGLAVVLKEVSHESGPIRAMAASALGEFKAKASTDALHALLRDPAPQVRVAAAASLVKRHAQAGRR